MANWFVTLAGTELGPLTDAQLRQMAREGKIAPGDPVRKEGVANPIAAGRIQGLFTPNAPPTPSVAVPAAPEAGTFSAWYGSNVGTWFKPFQVLAWIFYGFLWIPAWWEFALWNDHDPLLQTKGKRVLKGVAVGIIVFMIMAALGRTNQRQRANSPSLSPQTHGRQITSEMSAQAEALRQQVASSPTSLMAVDQFRREILGRDFVPKESFYKKYGRPLRTLTVADDTYLTYKCREGFVTVKCPAGPFQVQDDIAPVAVDER